MKHSISRNLLLLLFMVPLLGGQLSDAAEKGEGMYHSYLPSVHLPLASLKYVGQVTNPTDIIDTPFGLLVSESQSYIKNLTAGNVFLDLSARPNIARFQSIVLQDNYLYTLYVVYDQAIPAQYLTRFNVSGGIVDPNSEQVILSLIIPAGAEHLGGDLNFGPDGYLYVSTGDGSPQGDPDGHAQDKTNLFGSILRLNVTNSGLAPDCYPGTLYSIPTDNPFADGSGGDCDEIWANGLRQPWRVSFDSETGDFWVTDVGLAQREELNFQPATSTGGENYGWRCYEGSAPFNPTGCNLTYEFPVYEYSHSDGRCAIIGGFIYRGSKLTPLIGQYIFADFCTGEILAYNPDTDTADEVVRMQPAAWTTFGEGLDGELYVADNRTGIIYRLQIIQY